MNQPLETEQVSNIVCVDLDILPLTSVARMRGLSFGDFQTNIHSSRSKFRQPVRP